MDLKKIGCFIVLISQCVIPYIYGEEVLTMSNPTVKIDARGTSTAIWINTSNDITTMQSSSKPWEGSWGKVTDIFDSPSEIYDFQMTMNDTGDILLVWPVLDPKLENYVLYAANLPSEGTWFPATMISDPSTSIANTYSIAINSSGEMAVIWNVYNEAAQLIVQSSNGTIGGVWSAPTPVVTR